MPIHRDQTSPPKRRRRTHELVPTPAATSPPPSDHTQGNYESTLASLSRLTSPTVHDMSRTFTEVIVPLGSAPGTRIKAWRNWCTCLTWAIGRHATDKILPMHPDVLHAMLWPWGPQSPPSKASSIPSSPGTVTRNSNPQFLATCPISASPDAWGRLLGTQHPHKMSITRDMIVRLLRYQPMNLVEYHNQKVVCTLTMGCMRPGEGAQAQTCCVDFDSDHRKGLSQYKSCSTITTLHCKNDQERKLRRKGHWMRFGKSDDPDLDINHQLGLFMDLTGTRPSKACTALSRPGRRCTACPPLFPKLVRGPGDTWVLHSNPTPSTALVSGMVTSALRMIGVDTAAFS